MFDWIICENIQELLSQGKAFTNAFGAFRNWREQTETVDSPAAILEELQQRSPGGWTRIPLFRSASPPSPTFRTRHRRRERAAIELISNETLEARLTGMLTSLVHDRLSLSVSH